MTTLAAGMHFYHPELNEPRPEAQIEASLGHYGRHYFVYSAVPLSGRGVKFIKTITPGTMVNDRRNGWHHYKVTEKAMEAISKAHAVAYELLLD